jgi:UDP-N-acetylglucosamine acyltransferase
MERGTVFQEAVVAVQIHPSAIVHPKAKLGADVVVGPGAILGEFAEIGDRTDIGPHVVIDGWTTLGADNRIFTGAVLGSQCQDLKFRGERSYVKIGNKNTIREYVTVNRATAEDRITRIGDGNLIMAYAHVAHDCIIGNHNIIANAVQFAGHIEVYDYANIGGANVIHQYVRIGSYSMIGGGSRVPKDVPPYILCAGSPLRIVGINKVGLERKGFTEDQIKIIEHAYRIMYRSKLNVSQALKRLEQENTHAEVTPFIDFIKSSERGISK